MIDRHGIVLVLYRRVGIDMTGPVTEGHSLVSPVSNVCQETFIRCG
jgi:hypothetical protein